MDIQSKPDLISALAMLGYRIKESDSFSYTNSSNGSSYPARSVAIVESDTGKSFAHDGARRDSNFRALQKFRYEQDSIRFNGRLQEL